MDASQDFPVPDKPRSNVNAYVIAVLSTLAAALVRIWLDPLFGDRIPFTTFFIAVVVSAWLGGLRPALVAAFLGLVSSWYLFVPPKYTLRIPDDTAHFLGLFMYLFVCLAIAVFGEAMWVARRKAEHSGELLKQTLESITDGFLRLDRDWRVVYENAEAERINRIPRGESLGHTLWELFPEILGTKLEAEYRRCATERVSIEVENYFAPFERWYQLKMYPSPEGGLVVYYRDITEHKHAGERLRSSEEQYRTLFESMDEGYCVIEMHFDGAGLPFDYTILEINPAFEKHTGLIDAQGRRVRDMVPDLETSWYEIYGRVASTGEPIRFENHAGPMGDRWFDVYAFRIGGEGSRKVAILFKDISARKHAEESLRQKMEELQTLMETMPIGVFVAHDPECRSITGNAAAQQMLRSSAPNLSMSAPDEARPRHFRVMRNGIEIPPEDLPVQRAARGEHVRDEEVDDLFDDGTVLHTLMSAAPLRDEHGRVRGAVATVLDVTRRKEAENALRDADRKKDEFIAMLAHELRNPLAPIRNGLQLLRLAGVQGPVEDARAMMDRQLSQLVRLVDDLLDVSRITLGKLELRRERIECQTVIETALEASRPVIELAGHRLEIELPPEPIVLEGDPTRLAQVVSNLLNNSTKYTPAGGFIRLSMQMEGGAAVLTVSDNGIGIPPAMLTQVFDMFTQVDRRLEKTTGGLGIGLSLVKGLVEMHGGTIAAHSEGEGRGSTFTVHLPASVAQPLEPPVPRPTPPDAPARQRILVVDDNFDAADSLGQLLEMLGHEVRTAYDGEAGVSAADDFRPDVVLMDIGMPKMNGYEAARRIREQPWCNGMVLVALTGWGQSEDRQKSAEAGFDHHLVKPVEAEKLLKLLATLRS